MREVDEIQSQAWAACSLAGRLDGHFRRIKVINVFMKCWVSAPEHRSWRCFMQEELKTNTGDRNVIIVQSFSPTLCDPVDCSPPGFPVLYYFLEFTQTHVLWVDSIYPSHALSPVLLLPSIFPSIRVFSNESALLIKWRRYWSFSFSISPSSDYSELISFRIDWFDLLAVQQTLKSLLHHHNLKSSILWYSAFFRIQFSHLYRTTGKTIACMDLCWQSYVSSF